VNRAARRLAGLQALPSLRHVSLADLAAAMGRIADRLIAMGYSPVRAMDAAYQSMLRVGRSQQMQGVTTLVPATHDATNVVFNGTANIKYRAFAIK